MDPQPTFTWTAGPGTIDSAGYYTAPSTGTGSATVTASTGGVTATMVYGTYVGTVFNDASGDGAQEGPCPASARARRT